MLRADGRRTVQIGDGAGHPQHPVMASGREAHALKSGLHQGIAPCVQRAEPPDHGRRHLGVAGNIRPRKACGLKGPGSVHPRLDLRRGLRLLFPPQRLVFNRGNADMEVNAVQQRAGYFLNVFFHFLVRAGAPTGGVAPPAALTGIHGAHQLELGGEPQRPAGTGHGDNTILQGLTQRL